ncbi:hypothetical protein C7T94_04335 [Pedobacter yulinensis]|uniref:Uncharacterized protein n=1 Tax=Pedobacter yulinensis TaxID=2126353 RepID=A0A2T3HNE9_9SPHI|nr:hypothetical protein C7T94_04335 [Pedobacter yulinensis]
MSVVITGFLAPAPSKKLGSWHNRMSLDRPKRVSLRRTEDQLQVCLSGAGRGDNRINESRITDRLTERAALQIKRLRSLFYAPSLVGAVCSSPCHVRTSPGGRPSGSRNTFCVKFAFSKNSK